MRKFVLLLVTGLLGLASVPSAQLTQSLHLAEGQSSGRLELAAGQRGVLPVRPLRVVREFQPPAHRYGAGHRGVDLAAVPAQAVLSPVAGVVRFTGDVAGRPVVSLETATGIVFSFEPVSSSLQAGVRVAAGELLGKVGGLHHCSGGCVHVGVRRGEDYLNPLSFLLPKPRLLPLRG